VPSLFNLLVLGLGDLRGEVVFHPASGQPEGPDGIDYRQLFLWPTFMALAAAVVLAIAFWPPKSLATSAETEDDLETEPSVAL